MHYEVAQEGGMPRISMAFEEPICLLEREQIDDEASQRRGIADLFVENVRVAWCEHAVCAVCEVGHEVYHGVAQTFEAHAVGERVDVKESIVCWLSVLVGWWNGPSVEP